MDEFFMKNPALAQYIIGILIAIVAYFIKQSFDNLTAAIASLEETNKTIITEIGKLKDRQTEQETTCEMQRAKCPTNRLVYPSMGGGMSLKRDPNDPL